jgi:putative transposase
MKKRFTEEQIIGFLREADAGLPVKELCRKHGFSEPSYYAWKAKFGGMRVSDAQRLKALESVTCPVFFAPFIPGRRPGWVAVDGAA